MKDTSSQQKSNFGRLVTSGNVRVALGLVEAFEAELALDAQPEPGPRQASLFAVPT